MNIQLGELHKGDKQTITIAYLAMLQPMMQHCGSAKQNMQFDLIYRNLASGREINQEELRNLLKKITERTSTEDEIINHYSKEIINIVALSVKVFVEQTDAAFDVLIEELTKLIASLNDAVMSLEDIIAENLTVIKKLEEKQGKIGKYMQAEMIKGEATDKKGRPKRYLIHSDLDKLFEEATESIRKILAERGMVNKQAYIDQVVFSVQRILKIPIAAVIALQKVQEKEKMAGAVKAEVASEQAEKIALPDQPDAIANSPIKAEEGDASIEETFAKMDKDTFLNAVKDLAEGSASYAHGQEPLHYDKLCRQQAQYKFTKTQQKQLTSWLEKAKKLLQNESGNEAE